jgi:ABC-type dipeptide/oligopeptide/nickel transport system permease component
VRTGANVQGGGAAGVAAPRARGVAGHAFDLTILLARKAALGLAIFFVAASVLFFAIRAVPGDPVALRLKNPDPVRVAEMRARLGLDDAVAVQWWRYVESFVVGDWGRSFTSGRAVLTDMAEFLPATLELGLAGLCIGVFVGVAGAVAAEVFRVGWLRRFSFVLGTVGLTVPIFWIGMLLLILGSWWLGWFPSSGRFDPTLSAPTARTGFLLVDALLAGDVRAWWSAVNHLVLPAVCLSVYPAAQVCAVLQARLQDRRLQTLLVSLRARGLGPVRVWWRHVPAVVSAPLITVIGSNFGALLGGAVLTETVFSWPGVGRYLVGAVLDRDLFVVQNVLLAIVLLVVAVVFAADLAASVMNPAAMRGAERQGCDG